MERGDYTKNYNLLKPAKEDFYDIADFNKNVEIIDKALKALKDKGISLEALINSLADVAQSGNYNDLNNKPTSLKNPYALTMQFNGTTQKTYNGSSAQTLNITPSDIGAALNTHNHNNASTSSAGFMSSSDKSKLDGITSSADSVSFTRNLTSGTKVGTITINGSGTDLYCQTNTDTKNTAGSSNSTDKLYLIGAASQNSSGVQTYSNGRFYVEDTALHMGNSIVVHGTGTGAAWNLILANWTYLGGHNELDLYFHNNNTDENTGLLAYSTSNPNIMSTDISFNVKGKIYEGGKLLSNLYAALNHSHETITGTLPVSKGGTGSSSVIGALKNIGLLNSAFNLTNNIPSGSLLFYKNIADLGFTANTTMFNFFEKLPLNTSVCIRNSKDDNILITDAPTDYSQILCIKGNTRNYRYALSFDCTGGDYNIYYWAAESDGVKVNWRKINDGGNADTVDGKHAGDFAPSGFGLGEGCKYLSKINLNNVSGTGFFMFNINENMQNCPTLTGYTGSTWYMIQMEHTNKYKKQIAYPLFNINSSRNKSCTRICDAGVWSPWEESS